MGYGRAQDVVTSVDCDLIGLVCNVCSQPSTISLYHPGPYLTWPPSTNVLMWEFTDSEGNILHQDTLVDASTVSFGFDLPLTDTLFVSVLHTNDSVFHNGSAHPWACLVEDHLAWQETEIIPGTFQGSWTLGGGIGVDVSEPSGGCTYEWACNFDSSATVDDGSCEIESCGGCTVPEAMNYDPQALIDDGSCEVIVVDDLCQGDINGDGIVATGDLLFFLTAFGEACE